MACREAMQLKSGQFKIDQGYNDEKKFIWFIIWYKHLWYLSTWAMYNFVTVQGDSLQNQEKKKFKIASCDKNRCTSDTADTPLYNYY